MGQIETRSVIRIEIVGEVTSFRVAYMMQGYQPTYDMPPPSTIHGHLCSAVGKWVQPDESLQFGYIFTCAGKFIDYKEHLHFDDPIQPFPFDRELLCKPRLILYVTQLDLLPSFISPHYAVVLGRSQDLMTYLRVEVVQLERRREGYFEHTILPTTMAPRLDVGTIVVTMPSLVNEQRQARSSSYALLQHGRAIWPPSIKSIDDDEEDESMGLILEDDDIELWIDPDSPRHPRYPMLQRAIWFHRFDV